jgi:itaconyl-CoA hydratase
MSFYGYVRLGPKRYRERFGLRFEDVSTGLQIHHRPGIDVSQQDNREDAVDLINNAQLHYDSHYAAQTEWKNPLGVSTLTVQRLLGMSSRTWYARRRLLGIDSIAMTHPVFGGDTLYAASSVTALDSGKDPDVGQVSISIEGSNQRGQVVSNGRAAPSTFPRADCTRFVRWRSIRAGAMRPIFATMPPSNPRSSNPW